jgi:hypothetical protein
MCLDHEFNELSSASAGNIRGCATSPATALLSRRVCNDRSVPESPL